MLIVSSSPRSFWATLFVVLSVCSFISEACPYTRKYSCSCGIDEDEWVDIDDTDSCNDCYDLCLAIFFVLRAEEEFRCSCSQCCDRRLADAPQISSDRALTGEDWQVYQEQCNEFDFDLTLQIDSHVYVAAIPQQEGEAAGCAPLAIHARGDSDDDKTPFEKQVLVVESESQDPKALEDLLLTATEDGIALGTFSFDKISEAFDKADANAPGMLARHNIVENNCGDFILQFGKHMGIKATPKLTQEIAQRIAERADAGFADKIRTVLLDDSSWLSWGRRLLVRGAGSNDEQKSDQEMVHWLVESRTMDLYD